MLNILPLSAPIESNFTRKPLFSHAQMLNSLYFRYSNSYDHAIFVLYSSSEMSSQGRWKQVEQETTGFEAEKREKRGFDRSVIDRSNWGWSFVFNRSAMGGGRLAEVRRQRAAEDRVIW
jgi:hypothetical protein